VDQDGSHDLGVDGEELLCFGVVHVADADVGRETGGDLVAANGGGGVHRADNLDAFKGDEFQVGIVEALVANDLLEEGDQLDRFVLVGNRQVDVLQEKHQSLALFWAVNPTH